MVAPSFCVLVFILKIAICSEEAAEKEDFVPRVVNGFEAGAEDVPYQIAFKVKLRRSKEIYYATFCGGAILAPSKVLSAAHCFEEPGIKCFSKGKTSMRKLASIKAVAGSLYNLGKFEKDSKINGQWRTLKSMVYPPSYKFPKNDISVGRTTKPFTFNANVGSIPYATKYIDYRGTCLASGFGQIKNAYTKGDNPASGVLLLAHMDMLPTDNCNRIHRMNMRHFVCTDTVKADVSKGDSGGPLVCLKTGDPKEGPRGILVGVVSGARLRVGSFFTRVSSYTRFIASLGTSCRHNIVVIYICLIYGIYVPFFFCFFLFFL